MSLSDVLLRQVTPAGSGAVPRQFQRVRCIRSFLVAHQPSATPPATSAPPAEKLVCASRAGVGLGFVLQGD